MENRKDIGKALKDKLNNLEKIPSDRLWTSIENDLNKKKKRKRLFWFISSLIIVGLLSTILFFDQTQQEKNSNNQKSSNNSSQAKKYKNTVNKNSIDTVLKSTTFKSETIARNKKTESSEITSIKKNKTQKLIKQSSKMIVSTDEYEESEVIKKYKVVIQKNKTTSKINKNSNLEVVKKTHRSVAKKQIKQKNDLKKKKSLKNNSKVVSNIKTLNIENNNTEIKQTNIETEKFLIPILTDTIKKININSNPKKNSIVKREYKKGSFSPEDEFKPNYYVSLFYSPTIFGSLTGESMLNPDLSNLSRSHPLTSFYGFYFKTMYNKIGFRVGVSKINLKISTRLKPNQLIPNYKNIELNSNNTAVSINNTFNGSKQVDLIQQLSFYELPMEFNYSIIKNESDLGIDIFSGFSTMILDQNILYLSSEKIKNLNIGYAKNISGVNISYNLGLGLNYKITEKFQLDFNPIFKYYLTSFKENNNPKPYSFSIQSGLTYKLK